MSEENAELTRELVKDQIKKFDEKYIEKKFNELGDALTNSLKEQNNKTSYSEVLKKDTQNDFQTIIRVAKLEEKKEEQDHFQRQKNVIIHGATKDDSKTEEDQRSIDKFFVDDLLRDISYKTVPNFIVNSKNMSNLIGREEAYKSRISYFTCKI